MLSDDDYAKLGRAAQDAIYKTPLYSTWRCNDDEKEVNKRKNDIAIGQALVTEIRDTGVQVAYWPSLRSK